MDPEQKQVFDSRKRIFETRQLQWNRRYLFWHDFLQVIFDLEAFASCLPQPAAGGRCRNPEVIRCFYVQVLAEVPKAGRAAEVHWGSSREN